MGPQWDLQAAEGEGLRPAIREQHRAGGTTVISPDLVAFDKALAPVAGRGLKHGRWRGLQLRYRQYGAYLVLVFKSVEVGPPSIEKQGRLISPSGN